MEEEIQLKNGPGRYDKGKKRWEDVRGGSQN